MNFSKDWAEWIGTFLLIIGLIVALIINKPIVHFIVIFIAGMISGRLWYKERKQIKFPFFLILLGLILGYSIGIIIRKGDIFAIIFTFLLGLILNYILYKTKILE